MREPIFIIGMPRSGTTLLSMILNAHSQLAISPETHYFTKYWHRCEQDNCLQDKEKAKGFVNCFLSSDEVKDMGFSVKEVEEIYNTLIQDKNLTHKTILQTILSKYASKQGKTIWGEKTPAHLEYVPVIATLFPNARFICIVRDPRDVSLSLRKVPWNRGNVFHHARRWKRYIQMSQYYAQQYYPNFLEIKFEDLLANPESVIYTICSYLGLPFEVDMLAFHKKARLNFDLAKEPWKAKSIQPLDQHNTMKWLNQMPAYEVKVIEIIARKELKQKNYLIKDEKWNPKLVIRVFIILLMNVGHALLNRMKRLL